MKGIIKLLIVKRVDTTSNVYKDKWNVVDKLILTTISTNIKNHTRYKVESIKLGLSTYVISKDELAFLRLVFNNYGSGNYCIRTWAKGKKVGIRTFWDGLITEDKKFIRKRNTGLFKDSASVYEKSSFSDNDFGINKYMKTLRPGVWYNL